MIDIRKELVDVALGNLSPDLVLRGGKIINVLTREIYQADILIKGERIAAVGNSKDYTFDNETTVIDLDGKYISPGFMDPHFHIESSSITVTELTKLIVPKGVTLVAEDPHEIANVFGKKGIELLYEEGRQVPLKFFLRVPGKVPPLPPNCDTSGASLSFEETMELMEWPETLCLAGDINPFTILNKDEEQFRKIDETLKKKITVSGQSPGLKGKNLSAFVAAGPEDSHVSATAEEVLDITRQGLKAMLTHRPNRFDEGEFKKLAKMIDKNGFDSRNLLLHTDDTHANQLQKEGHLEFRIRLAIENGIDPITAIQMATINVAEFFRIDKDYGSITPGKYADFAIIGDLEKIIVDEVYICGKLVAKDGHLLEPLKSFVYPSWAKKSINIKNEIKPADLQLCVKDQHKATVRALVPSRPKDIELETLRVENGIVMPDPSRNIVCIAVIERHKGSENIGNGFLNFPLKTGAFASSVTHDSHNIFVVGVNFEDMALAINQVVENQGGYAVVANNEILGQVEMPIAGLMSEEPFEVVAKKMENVERMLIDRLGCKITYRPLYFFNLFPLPNIPKYGFTEKGLISTEHMKPIEIVVD